MKRTKNMPTHAETIEDIREEVEKRHECRAVHVRSNLVKTVLTEDMGFFHQPFERNVETFELVGHPTALLAYGWELDRKTRKDVPRILIYLHNEPITSPKAAVDEWAKGDWLKSPPAS